MSVDHRNSPVVFVSPHGHHGAHSGAKHRAISLCKIIAEHREVILFSPWTPGVPSITHVDFSLDGGLIARMFRYLWISLRLIRLNSAFVISEGALPPISFGRYKLVHVIHDTKFATIYGRKGAAFARFGYKLAAILADKILTVSQAEATTISRLFKLAPERIIASYNGVSAEWLSSVPSIDLSSRPYDIIYVSNLAPHKGHLSLLEAVRERGLRLAFVGADFGQMPTIKEQTKKYDIDVRFYQSLSEAELINLYDSAKAFVFPSEFEGFGIPFVEARARGLPVVCNDLPVFRELSRHLGGSVVDCKDADLFFSAIDEALSHKTTSRPSQEALAAFTWEHIAEKLLAELD